MADGSRKTARTDDEAQLPAPKLHRQDEWYYPPSGAYSPKRYYLCEYCEYKSTNSLRFKSHLEKSHPKARIKLSPSRRAYNNRVAFKTNGSTRNKKRRMKLIGSINQNNHRLVGCNLCEFRTTVMRNLRIHMSKHKKRENFQCSKCSYSASNMAQVNLHLNRDHSGESEKSNSELMDADVVPIQEKNGQAVKGEEISPIKIKRPEKILYCDYCDYSTVITTNMRCHTARHKKNERFKCHLCNYSAGLKHNVEKHVRFHHIPKDGSHQPREVEPKNVHVEPRLPEVLLEELVVSPADGPSPAESEILAESEFEQWKKSTTNRERICNAGHETSIFLCPKCSYWNRGVLGFHDHIQSHRGDASFRCSDCDYVHRFRSKVNLHIRKEKKTNGISHSNAKTVMINPVPADKYASYRRAAVIEKGLSYGWTTMTPNSAEEMHCADEEPSQSSSVLSDQHSSECKDLDDITNGLEQRLQDFDSASPTIQPARKRMRTVSNIHPEETKCEELEAEEVELRKEIVRARKAIFDSLSNSSDKSASRVRSTEEEGHLEKLRLRIDSMKMKVKSTEEEVESLTSMKSDVRKKINEVTGAKMKAEYELRSHQCEVLSLQLAAHETLVLAEVEKSLADAEEKVKHAEKDVERKEAELESFKKEYDSLRERREQAEEALAGASQVLQGLEAELKVMEESKKNRVVGPSGCSTTQERIKDCMQLEKRLLKITYLKSLAKVCQQEKEWLVSIQRYEEQELVLPSKSSVDPADDARKHNTAA